MLVVGISTMSLIIVLSVFNGLEGLLRSLYESFDPEIAIFPSEGKSFDYSADMQKALVSLPGTADISEVVEDNVLIKYNNAQRVVRMKGVSENYLAQGRLQQSIVTGKPVLTAEGISHAIIGRGIQYDLSIQPSNDFFTLQVYYPRTIKPGISDPTSLYKVQHLMPSAVFAIEKYYDDNYIYVPMSFALSLLDYGSKRSSLEVTCTEGYDREKLRNEIQAALGDKFRVLLGEEIHQDLYKILRIEKLFVFILLTLIIGIASINIYFVLTMLAIDKKKDMAILATQGASKKLIQNIFMKEGAMIAITGAGTGLFLGLAISFLQQEFGIISMGMQTTIMDAYPIRVEGTDVLATCAAIILITVLIAIQPARLAAKNILLKDL